MDVICDLKLENFQGPFDLLFHLIEKNEMDLYDIQISEITEQYLDYLFTMESLNMDIASEFLVMAATLLHIKSRMLLPTVSDDEEEMDPREQLVLQLLEYKRCKASAGLLKDIHSTRGVYFYRPPSNEDFGKTEKTYTLAPGVLRDMYLLICDRNIAKKNINARKVNNLLRHEKYTVEQKLRQLVKLLFEKEEISFFEEFMKEGANKLDSISGFLSILEMARSRKAKLRQRGIFEDIMVRRTDQLKEDDFTDVPELYK
jgi:segregation and condensation protein A